MLQLIKNYGFRVLFYAVLVFWIWWIIPYQEKQYLESDLDIIKEKCDSIVFWVDVTVFGGLFIFLLIKYRKSSEDIALITFNTVFLPLVFFIFFSPLFRSATLFLNSISTTQIMEKRCLVMNTTGEKNDMVLWDIDAKKSVDYKRAIPPEDAKKLYIRDTLILSFNKGLLGFKLHPNVKTVNSFSSESH